MKQIMKKKSKMLKNVTLIFLAVIICFSLTMIYKLSIPNDIDSILENKYYSYLPIEAKNYLKGVYLETGELLLTEKNKEKNKSYLNPQFVEYLTTTAVSEGEQENDYIPEATIVDYIYTSNVDDTLPSRFHLGDVNGMNFLTPVQNQYGGLCWAYSSTSQIESLLLINKNESYKNGATIFSERQLDFATSSDGIVGNKSLYPYRQLYNDGGTYYTPWVVGIDGLSLVDISWQTGIETSTAPMEPNKVYNFSNSLYEIDNTFSVPNLKLAELNTESEEEQEMRESYLNTIKSIIKNYGGAVAGSVNPLGDCSIKSGDTRLIYDNDVCTSGGAHAMQIVGWDDEHEYSFCEYSDYITEDISNCPQENVVSSKGAWILKNSWGDSYPYLYLAYDSSNSGISTVTKVDEKKWDNYYHVEGNSTTDITFNKKISSSEKIEKLKFKSPSQNTTYDIYIAKDGINYELVESVDTTLPGYYTVDLSSKNLVSDNDTIKARIKYGSKYLTGNSENVRIYTSNIDEVELIDTDDATYEENYSKQSDYIIRISSNTKGIQDGSAVMYKILDANQQDITVNYSYEENTVYANRIYSKIIIDSSLENGEYILQTIYNNIIMSESKITISGQPVLIEGSGTKTDPYIITNSKQLNLIRKNNALYYELGNDIDLTYDTQNENGLFYNNGLGWEPIDFYSKNNYGFVTRVAGHFDGNGHKIIGLYINRPDEDYVGLFRQMKSMGNRDNNAIMVSNLIMENSNITGKDYVGAVAGFIDSNTSIYSTELKKIYIIGGRITGNNYVGGIVGLLKLGVYYDSHSDRINSWFNSASIKASNYAGGLIGRLENAYEGRSGFKVYINNIMNTGTITSDGNASGFAGSVKMLDEDPITIENGINIGNINGKNCSNDITCDIADEYNGKLYLKNIYYLGLNGYDVSNNDIIITNVMKKTTQEMSVEENYTEWNEFNNNWKIEQKNDIFRTPVLKELSANYISLSSDSIVLTVNQKTLITDYFNPNDIYFYISDTEIAEINANEIIAKTTGKTDLILSNGYEAVTITIYVLVDEEYNLTFDSNGGTGTMSNQKTILQNDVNLNKNEFVKEGYKFKEWNTRADGTGTSYKDEQKVLNLLNEEVNVTLYAQWRPITYKIVFNSNDGTNKTKEQTFIYDEEQTLLSNPFGNTEFNFLQWNTKADGTGITYQNEQNVNNLAKEDNAKINLYAIWESYTISFDANGGTLIASEPMEDIIVKVSDYMVTSVPYSKFTKEGYRMWSWNTKPDGSGKRYLQGGIIEPTADTILYAQWEAKQYNVKYYYKLNNVVGTIKTVLFTYDTETELLEARPDEEGYKFVYWGTKADGTGTNYLPKQKVKNLSTGSDVTLYTIFSPITYKVVFNSNDGTSMTSEQIFTYDEEQLLKSNTYTKEGFKFKEWNTKADGTGTPYTNEQSVKNLATEDNAIINLYAIWEDQEYSITLDANEGKFEDNKTTLVIENWEDSKLESLEIPTRNGYEFKGYYTEKSGGTSLEMYIAEVGIDKDGLIFYAQWEVNKYTLKFNANGGTGTMNDQEFVHDALQKITKNAYTREGFKFKEWNTKADGTGTAYTNEKEIKLSDDLTLYAIWEETYSYIINKYSYDDNKKYIDKIDINTTVDNFKKNIDLNIGYSIDVNYKIVEKKNLLYTGSKTKIYKNNNLIIEYTNIIRGEVTGDAKINYLDYVNVYNHIQKVKHPELDKKELKNEYLISADMSGDGKVNYLDYVQIYNKIKELKGGN